MSFEETNFKIRPRCNRSLLPTFAKKKRKKERKKAREKGKELGNCRKKGGETYVHAYKGEVLSGKMDCGNYVAVSNFVCPIPPAGGGGAR